MTNATTIAALDAQAQAAAAITAQVGAIERMLDALAGIWLAQYPGLSPREEALARRAYVAGAAEMLLARRAA